MEELKDEILKSLLIEPCSESTLEKRDFLKSRSTYGISRIIQQLETDGAIFYKDSKSEIMHVKRSYIRTKRKHLFDYI